MDRQLSVQRFKNGNVCSVCRQYNSNSSVAIPTSAISAAPVVCVIEIPYALCTTFPTNPYSVASFGIVYV
jgi:hypothetical protein